MPKKPAASDGSPKKYTYERVTFYHNGKQYETSGKTLKDAHAKAARKKLALETGEIGISGNMTVARWAEEWLETYKEHSVGEGQYRNYKSHIYSVIIPAIGAKKLRDVKDVDLQKILNSRAGTSGSDLSKLRMTLKALFKRARISRLIAYDPAEELELPTAKNGTHRSITASERVHILHLAEAHHAGLWIKTMMYCGLRPGETRALDWRHVDLKKKLIRIQVAMKAGTRQIDTPKTPAGVRDIPIPDSLYEALLAAKKGPFEPVFTKPLSGKRHDDKSMQAMWGNFKRELDIAMGAKLYRNKITLSVVAPDLVPYCLRHTYGTDLQDAGVPINIAKYLMGHSDISVTANIYTHVTESAIADAAKKINTAQKGKKKAR